MENNIMNYLETALLVGGVSIGLAEIQTLAGVIILGIQVVLLLVRLIFMIVDKAKKKDYQGIAQEIDGTLKVIEEKTAEEKKRQIEEERAKKEQERLAKEQERVARENAKIDAEIAKLQAKKISVRPHKEN